VHANNVEQFAAYAKSHQGELNYGSPGIGGPHHLAMELFKHFIGYFCLGFPQVESDRLELENAGWEERRFSEACMRVAPLA
jgi:hypothetical protein